MSPGPGLRADAAPKPLPDFRSPILGLVPRLGAPQLWPPSAPSTPSVPSTPVPGQGKEQDGLVLAMPKTARKAPEARSRGPARAQSLSQGPSAVSLEVTRARIPPGCPELLQELLDETEILDNAREAQLRD